MKLSIIILAAGQGKRMFSAKPKVLHRLAGKPLLQHVIKQAQALQPENLCVIYGHGGDQVLDYFKDSTGITWIEQKEQLGTGHAVQQALPFLNGHHRVLILVGDAPLVSPETLSRLVETTQSSELGWVTALLQNPTGFGRIIRDHQRKPIAIVEEKDATDEQRAVREINTGICLIPVSELKRWVGALNNKNEQKEYYLTDVFSMAVDEGIPIQTILAQSETEVLGINDPVQLAYLERAYQHQQAERLMLAGLTLLDPKRFDLRGNLQFGKDVVIDINVLLEGEIVMGSNCYIGPNVILKNVKLGDHVRIEANSVMEDALVRENCVVGPFARIRPGTVLNRNARVGNFVEIKKSELGEGSKANHLTYLGDATIGKDVNIGAGTITCNYDGVYKHHTIIEDEVFIGSNTALVAPVKIERGATIGAGSTITRSAPANKLTLARSRQVTLDHWEKPKRKRKHLG